MFEAVFRASCLVLVAVGLVGLPWPILALVILAVIGMALVENRTTPHRIEGMTLLITGASSGLGKALAIEAARRRAKKVVIVARSAEKLELTAAAVRALGAEAVVMPCDVGDPVAVAALHDALIAEHGVPNILVNNAGAGAWQHIEEGTAEEAQSHMAVPYLGAVYLTQQFAPDFAKRGSGHVLCVTSAASLAGFRAAVTYGSARWAMRGLAQYLRADLAEQGIGVTLLNAAEIGGTSYFDNAPGKAGAASHARIPWLFHLGVVKAFMGDTTAVARAALDGMASGTHEILYPQLLMVPVKLFGDLFPELLHASLRLGPNGRR